MTATHTEAPTRRMDQIFTAIGDAIGSIFDNPVIRLGIQLAVIYWVILWIAASYWAFRDMQSRTDNPLAPYLAAAFVIIFTPLLFPLAVFTYRIIRPQERIGEIQLRDVPQCIAALDGVRLRRRRCCLLRSRERWYGRAQRE